MFIVIQLWKPCMKFSFAAAIALAAALFVPACLPALAAEGAPIVSDAQIPVWTPTEDTEIRYDVLRKGKPFGTHVSSFSVGEDGTLSVTHDIELKAKIGPVTVYKYSHKATERWQDSQLIALRGETRKNGDELSVTASRNGDSLTVSGSNFDGTVEADIVPATHWNIRQMFEGGILSTEGGQTLETVVEELGRETLTIDGEDIETTKFSLASDLTVFLWYDDNGRWVRCEFTARGQKIEYELTSLY